MRTYNTGRYATLALLLGGLACAGNKANTDDGTVVSTDTTQTQNPPGYRGTERDTAGVPNASPTPTDTFLNQQGAGAPSDTSAWSGGQQVDSATAGVNAQQNRDNNAPVSPSDNAANDGTTADSANAGVNAQQNRDNSAPINPSDSGTADGMTVDSANGGVNAEQNQSKDK